MNKYKGSKGFSSHKIRGKGKKRKILKIILLVILGIILLGIVWGMVWYKKNVVNTLPDISSLQDISFDETTVITDRNGEVLYRLFDENREYIEYSEISDNMTNAIVALEDQRYREHDGLDYWGIIRAATRSILYRELQGGSTIEQQLLKNLLINQELSRESFKDKVVRKFQEILLTKKLDKLIRSEIEAKQGDIGSDELHLEQKKKSLELYLNYLDFGNSSYGVEAASKLYFDKSAKDLNILDSAILASIPKSASVYNPYTRKENIMGGLNIKDSSGNNYGGTGNIKKLAINKIEKSLENSSLARKKTSDDFQKFIKGLCNFSIDYEGSTYYVSYSGGRKDVALVRMFADEYISESELKKAFVDGLDFNFKKGGFDIKAPHFVFWVIERLKKDYDIDTLRKGGFVIKTSLDRDVQQIAEESIKDNKSKLESYGASNNSMLYLDSKDGDVIAYVGSIDYFDLDIEGENDMVQAKRQVGSTMKPFIYALGLENLPLTLDTPIYDIPFSIGSFRPNNADGDFLGILPLKHALGYSRNIPAVKMYFAVGGEDKLKPYLKKLGINSLIDGHGYGYSLALGAAEISMMELANGYMHLSSLGSPAEINPILEIRTNDGAIIYKKKVKKQDKVIKSGVAYLMGRILYDRSNMPGGWVGALSVKGLNLAIKSGTSNMKTKKGGRARDGWLATYTPSKVAIFWAGNADGGPLYRNAYGGFLNSSAMKSFWGELVKNNYVSNEGVSQIEVSSESISKLSGKGVGDNTPMAFRVSSIGYINRPANQIDNSLSTIKYDAKCGGRLSPFTLEANIKEGYLFHPSSFMPDNMDLGNITEWWKGEGSGYNTDIIVEDPVEYCDEVVVDIDESIVIKIENVRNDISPRSQLVYNVHSDNGIKSVSVLMDESVIQKKDYEGDKNDIIDSINFDLGNVEGTHSLSIIIVDGKFKMNQKTIKINILEEDTNPPYINEDSIVVVGKDGDYSVVIVVEDDLSYVQSGEIKSDGKIIYRFDRNIIDFKIDELLNITITARDIYGNESVKEISLSNYYN